MTNKQGVMEGGFFDIDKPKIGDIVQHKHNKSMGKVKKIGTQDNETWIYFKDNRTGIMMFGRWKKDVFPIKNEGVNEVNITGYYFKDKEPKAIINQQQTQINELLQRIIQLENK